MSNNLQLRFIGDIKPQNERAHDIGEVMSAFEDALAVIVVRRHPQLKRDTIALGLTKIEHESVGLVFEPDLNELVFSAALELIGAIQDKAWANLPYGSLAALRKILRFVIKKKCTAQLKINQAEHVVSTLLTPETVIPSSVSLFGETEIYGQVRRAGGSEPKVEIRTLQGETLYCSTTEEIARQLGGRLYEQVGVRGAAEWNFETLEIEEFEITKVLNYTSTTPSDAFKKLSESFGSYFAGIDNVEEWAHEVRHGEADKV